MTETKWNKDKPLTLDDFEMPLVPGTLFHGADYNPEQWFFDPKVVEEEDPRLMLATHSNVMSIGMFSWSMLEPSEGRYELDYMEEIIDRLYDHGIYTFLSTPSGARPAWMSKKYPEVLRVREDRVRILHGHRHNHCFTSPVYREKVYEINRRLAERFSDHPGVLLWHISNEYGGDCHCDLCQEAFRNWLKERYASLDELNHAWWTTFWAHTYTDWSQIESPSSIGESKVHGQNLDWRRFVSHQTADFLRAEILALRDGEKRKLPTTHNFHDFVAQDLDYHVLAKEIDVVSWDNYPLWHHPERGDVREGPMRSFIHDINRTLKDGRPFLLMESSPSATNWQAVAKLRRPGLHGLQSMQAIAHGSDSAQYFQWRKSLGSSEKLHGAVIDHYQSEDTRVFREVKSFGEDLTRLGAVAGSKTKAEVAIVYDWENGWAYSDSEGPINIHRPRYYDVCNQHYRPFWEAAISVDVIGLNQDLSEYKVVVAPLLYLMPKQFADRVRTFVAAGGTFITGVWSGIVNETDLAYRTGRPGPLRDVLGIWVEETDALYEGEKRWVRETEGEGGYEATRLLDLIHLEGAEALYEYGEDFYEGVPAVTRHPYGEGEAYYLGFHSADEFYLDIYQRIIEGLDLRRNWSKPLPLGVTAQRRETKDDTYIFFLNFREESIELEIDGDYIDMMKNRPTTSQLTIPSYTYAILKKS